MDTARKIKPGAVFLVVDSIVTFPIERAEGSSARTTHDDRPVVVLQTRWLNTAKRPTTVLVAPCSASSTPDGDWQVRAGVPFERDTIILLDLVQPVLKGELGRHLGDLDPATLTEVQKQLATVMSLTNAGPPSRS